MIIYKKQTKKKQKTNKQKKNTRAQSAPLTSPAFGLACVNFKPWLFYE